MRPLPVLLALILPSCVPELEALRLDPVDDEATAAIADATAATHKPIVAIEALQTAPPESPRVRFHADDQAIQGAVDAATLEGAERRMAITLDRPLYRPGETIWARVWDVSAGTLEGPPAEAVTVQLLDPKGSVTATQLLEGKGAGAAAGISLSGSANGGLYTLRATIGTHTIDRPLVVSSFEEPRIRKELDLLRDAYGPGDEVTAALTVSASGAGPLIDHPVKVMVQVEGRALPAIAARTDTEGKALLTFDLPDTLRQPDVVLTVVVEEDGWTESISREVPVVLDQVGVEWFPEGGDLVTGLPSRVYLRARDAHGEPADVAGVVEDQDGNEVARFRTVHDGLARIDLTPERGHWYTARITEPASVQSTSKLPLAHADGCVLRSYDDLDGKRPEIRVGVLCRTQRPVLVTGSLRGEALDTAAVEAGPDAPAVVHLRAGDRSLDQGVARVTVLSETLDPVAERLIYRNRARQLQIDVTQAETQYSPRDEVVLAVTTRDPDGTPVAADVALSVVDDRLLKHADDEHGHLLTQLHVDPWVQGELEDPAWYFDPDEEEAGLGLDLVMGTHGWRRFERRRVAMANPDAGEGARARREEGKVGRRIAQLKKVTGNDRQIAENAGVLAALRDSGDLDGIFGASGLDANLTGGIGGLLGAKGTQFGGGGLGARGVGLGGGGTAEGLGGLGTRGIGSGAGYGRAGYGQGGGHFGSKGHGGIGTVGGDPIILGALDRTLIDAVVKRHMNQIRYCYQRELVKNPALDGKVVIKFVIAKDGTVSSATRKTTTMNSESVEQCIVGRFMRMQFPVPRGGGIVIVSYPFLFSAEGGGGHQGGGWGGGGGGGWGGGDAAPTYTTVRTFPTPDYSGAQTPATRTDFRSTVMWAPTVKTGEDGTAEVRFFLNDAVTTFTITAEGIGGGHAGRMEQELHSTRPFSLDVPLPTEVSFGDRLLVPIRVSSRRHHAMDVSLNTLIGGGLVAEDGTGNQTLHLEAGEGLTTLVPLAVPDVARDVRVSVSAAAGGLSDAMDRTLSVVPRGFPHRWSEGGELEGQAVHTVRIDDALTGGTQGQITLYPSSLSSLMDGMASMVRIPSGCFEQTSSSNYPNILVLRHLDRTRSDVDLTVDRTRALSAGYERLTSYQVASGGFETFGRGPGKEALSAYGILQFSDMQSVFSGVSSDMVAKDVAYLLSTRDGKGGYSTSGQSSHRWGAAPRDVTDAFITWALVETGHLGAGAEVERSRHLARSTADPYKLALATLALQHADPAAAEQAAAKLAGLQDREGGFPGADTSVVRSGGQNLLVETTALATMALHRGTAHGSQVQRGARWLSEHRRGNHGWGSTQATVLALKAIDALADGSSGPARGGVDVVVDGETVGKMSWTGTESGGVTFDIGQYLSPGEHTVALTQRSGKSVPYAVEATWRRVTPDSATDAPLALTTSMATERVALGETVRLTTTVTNPGKGDVASPIARLGLPAGVRAETWQLEALRDKGEIAFFETRPREVTLYWEGFGPGEERVIHLDLVAEVPGTFSAPPSSAYPYYDDDAKMWTAGATLDIRP